MPSHRIHQHVKLYPSSQPCALCLSVHLTCRDDAHVEWRSQDALRFAAEQAARWTSACICNVATISPTHEVLKNSSGSTAVHAFQCCAVQKRGMILFRLATICLTAEHAAR